jgi:O-antigen/teichoic acid export membrane protein
VPWCETTHLLRPESTYARRTGFRVTSSSRRGLLFLLKCLPISGTRQHSGLTGVRPSATLGTVEPTHGNTAPIPSSGPPKISSAGSAAGNVLARMLSLGARFLTSPFTNRALGAADRGVLSVVGSVSSLFTVGLTPNLAVSYYRTFPEKRHSLQDYAGTSVAVGAAAGATIIALFLVSYPFFRSGLYRNTGFAYLLLSFLAVPLLLVRNYLHAIFQGLGRMEEYNGIVRFEAVAGFLFTVALLAAGRFTVTTALLASIAIGSFSLGNTVWWLRRYVPRRWKVSRQLLGASLRDALAVHPAGLATFLFLKIDILMLNYFLPSVAVGQYFVAVTIAEVLFLIPYGTQAVLYSRVAREESPEAAAAVTVRAGRHSFYITLAGAACFAVLGRWLVTLVGGREYMPATLPLLVLLPGMVFQCLTMTLSPLWARKGMYGTMSVVAGTVAATNIALNLLLIPLWGISGAALATSASYGLNAAIWLILLARHAPSGPKAMFRVERDDLRYYRDLLDEIRDRTS